MMERWMIHCLYLQSEKAVTGFGQRNLFDGGDVLELASWYGEHGADALVVFDFSSSDEEHEKVAGSRACSCNADCSERHRIRCGHQ